MLLEVVYYPHSISCERPCPIGYYGIMCRRFCGYCASGRCDAATGMCTPADLPPHIIFSTPANRQSIVVSSTSTSASPHIMRMSGGTAAPLANGSAGSHNGIADAMRIKAKHWIAVAGNGRMQLHNCTNTADCRPLSSSSAAASPTPPPPAAEASAVDGAQLASLIDQTHRHHVQIQQNHSMMMTALNSSIANLTSDVGKLSQQIGERELDRLQHLDAVPKVALLLDAGDAAVLSGGGGDAVEDDVGQAHAVNAVNLVQQQTAADVLVEEAESGRDGKTMAAEEESVENDILHFVTLQGLNQSADSVGDESAKSMAFTII